MLYTLALLATHASAGMLGTTVTAGAFSSGGGCELSATVIDPGVEFVDAGPDLCMAGPTGRLDIDVADGAIRWDFTATQDFGFSTSTDPWLRIEDIAPTCPGGTVGEVVGIASVTTNLPASEWDTSLVSFGPDIVEILGDPMATGGDTLIRTDPGDFIDVELMFECPISLDISGTCPGPLSIDIEGITPGGEAGVILGSGLGSDVIPGGPCAGAVTDLSGASLFSIMTDGDSDGEIHISPNVTSQCGQVMQIVDRSSCTLSNAVTL